MTSRFLAFAFVELVSPYNKKNIKRWLEDMNFMFSWQEQYLLFLPLEHKIHIFLPLCNILFVWDYSDVDINNPGDEVVTSHH